MREKARQELDPDEIESAEDIYPYVKLDSEMVVLSIDITFDFSENNHN